MVKFMEVSISDEPISFKNVLVEKERILDFAQD